MQPLLDAVRRHSPGLDAGLVERHLRLMSASYLDRYGPADVARHLELLAAVSADEPVAVEVRGRGPHRFTVVVGSEDHPGTLACITTALAADHFDVLDVHIGGYCPGNSGGPCSPNFSIVQLEVIGTDEGGTADNLTERLHDRLQAAFLHLAQGQFLEAQAAAAATKLAPLDDSPVRVTPGTVLGGDYRLDRRLALGGMSEIYLATQLNLDRTVAVKIARRESSPDSELANRFTREAMVLAQFQCQYIVPVLTAGTIPGATGVLGWIAMEYQAGGDLARWMAQKGPPPVELGLRWFRQALEGLLYAHHNAVLHRDLKPHNLLLTAEGDVKVGDFGLFKHIHPEDTKSGGRRPVRGTPHYMSPEQARGEHLDERSDIFSLGTTFFHVFSGRLPFDAATPQELLNQIAQSEAPRLCEVSDQLPVPLAVVIGRMLARRQEERYQDVGVILDDLTSYESRRLLRSADNGWFEPVEPSSSVTPTGAETAAFVPAGRSDSVS